jgi:hypothetical protein
LRLCEDQHSRKRHLLVDTCRQLLGIAQRTVVAVFDFSSQRFSSRKLIPGNVKIGEPSFTWNESTPTCPSSEAALAEVKITGQVAAQ